MSQDNNEELEQQLLQNENQIIQNEIVGDLRSDGYPRAKDQSVEIIISGFLKYFMMDLLIYLILGIILSISIFTGEYPFPPLLAPLLPGFLGTLILMCLIKSRIKKLKYGMIPCIVWFRSIIQFLSLLSFFIQNIRNTIDINRVVKQKIIHYGQHVIFLFTSLFFIPYAFRSSRFMRKSESWMKVIRFAQG